MFRIFEPSNKLKYSQSGFTLIELMIVLAVIAILLSLALPVYSNYSTRAKIAEGLGVAAGAKTSTSIACQEDPGLSPVNNSTVGYTSTPDIDSTYISTISIGGDCINPVITITTRNTGAPAPDPIILLNGSFNSGESRVTWECTSDNTPHYLLPLTCRS